MISSLRSVSLGRSVLIFLLLWGSATLLVFIKLDQNIYSNHSGPKEFVHEGLIKKSAKNSPVDNNNNALLPDPGLESSEQHVPQFIKDSNALLVRGLEEKNVEQRNNELQKVNELDEKAMESQKVKQQLDDRKLVDNQPVNQAQLNQQLDDNKPVGKQEVNHQSNPDPPKELKVDAKSEQNNDDIINGKDSLVAQDKSLKKAAVDR